MTIPVTDSLGLYELRCETHSAFFDASWDRVEFSKAEARKYCATFVIKEGWEQANPLPAGRYRLAASDVVFNQQDSVAHSP